MKRIELWFTVILPIIDLVGLSVSLIVAQHLRTSLDIVPLDQSRFLQTNLHFLWWYFPLVIFFFSYHRLYLLFETRQLSRQFLQVFSAISTTSMILFMIVLFGRTPFVANHYQNWYIWANASSLLTVFYFWIAAIVLITALRFVYRVVLNLLLVGGVGQRRTLIIGNTAVAETLWQKITADLSLGYRFVGAIKTNHHECSDKIVQHDFSPKVVGSLEEIEAIVQRLKPDQIIQADPDLSAEQVLRLINLANEQRISFMFAPNLFEVLATNVVTGNIGGIPLLEFRRTPLDGWGKILKRGIDFCLSLLLIIITSPILLLFMFLIVLQDGGPVFFMQERISAGRPFRIIKFRSMVVNAEKMEAALRQSSNEREDGPLFKMKDDPRVTRLGRFMRKTRVDELPQLFNVIKGDMSLVGPRPHLPKEIALYQQHHRKVLGIKPGMTGLAQISGSSDLTFEEEVRLDTFYIEHWSLWQDLAILVKTPFWVLFKDKSGC